MPTPTERLEARKQVSDCRVCSWLGTLEDRARREWQKAIMNPRYGARMVADEAAVDGADFGEASVLTHRRKAHV